MESGNLPDCIEKGLPPGVNPVISMLLCEASAPSLKNFLKKKRNRDSTFQSVFRHRVKTRYEKEDNPVYIVIRVSLFSG